MISAKEIVLAKARALGFDAVGVARADVPLGAEHERYVRFVEGERHGEMHYLARDVEARRRLDGDAILEGARSVVCVARSYLRSTDDEAGDPDTARLIARYARGQDYHNHVRKKLRALAKAIRALGPEVRARPICDVEPVLERAWASRAGLGFVGKNGLVIVPGKGSFVLLGEVVTTLELAPDEPMTERCGSCTRCLDACPTGAFEAPFVLDPRRCISYVTIEARTEPPRDLGDRVGEHLFGCDDCQTACPFNRTAPPPAEHTRQFAPHARWAETDLGALARLDDAAFERLTEGSPLGRATRAGLARSAVRVAGHRARSDDPDRRRTGLAALEAATGAPDADIASLAAAELDRATRR